MPLQFPPTVQRVLDLVHIDWNPPARPPSAGRVFLVTVAAIVACLVADALLAAIGVAAFPSTKGYAHFRFGDYAKLTIIGVVIACLAWPIVTRITSVPRWLFFRMAVAVTLVLWLPDLYILAQGQPPKAVFVLMTMHLAIALITYNLLVRAAPARNGVLYRARRNVQPASAVRPSEGPGRVVYRPGPPAQAAGPAQATQPAQPMRPARPAGPPQPAQPAGPAQPTRQARPAGPAQPTRPAGPAQGPRPTESDTPQAAAGSRRTVRQEPSGRRPPVRY